jgi:hypothetical protein
MPMIVSIVARAARERRPPSPDITTLEPGENSVASTAAQKTGMTDLAMSARNASVVRATRKTETSPGRR